MPFAANEIARDEVISSAPVEVARAIPTFFEDEVSERTSVFCTTTATSSLTTKKYN
jgi:hypothetical protein